MGHDGVGDAGSGVRPYDVAIVGLGPTGAVLANLCGLHGLRTVVFERSADPFAQPRACHLDAEVARVLAQCGFASELHDVLTISAGMEFVDACGRRLFTFEGFERAPLLGWHEDYVFVQPELDALTRRGLERFAHVQVLVGTQAPGLGELGELAEWVVGCDGASSTIRTLLGVGLVDLGFDQEWLVVDVSLHEDAEVALPGIIRQVCDQARPTTFVPSHGRHRRWEFRLEPDEPAKPWDLLGGWGVTPDNADMVRASKYRFHALVADRWRGGPRGRVLLAGDAAHQMPPFMGQGMCSGIRDAASLAWRLAAPDAADLIDDYERERRPHVESVTAMSIQAGRLLDDLAADLAASRPLRLPEPDAADPTRWSRLPGLDLGGAFPIGHQVPGPPGLDQRLGIGWAWVATDPDFTVEGNSIQVVVEPAATYGHRALLVRPDRYIAAVAG